MSDETVKPVKTAKNRAEEICQLVPGASDEFKLRAVMESMTNEQVLLAYIAALEAGSMGDEKVNPRTAAQTLRKPDPIDWTPAVEWFKRAVALVVVLGVLYLLFLGARSAFSGLSIVPTAETTVTLPAHAQDAYAALSGNRDTAREAAHLFAALAAVQGERDGLTVGELREWMRAIGPDFRAMNPGLKPVGMDAPLTASVRSMTGESKLYAVTEIPRPAQWFGEISETAVAAVNRDRVEWSPL